MTKPINNIDITFYTGQLQPKQWASLGANLGVALVAIALAALALKAMVDGDLSIFHALVGMKPVGAAVLLGAGSFFMGILACRILNYLKSKNDLKQVLKKSAQEVSENFDLIFKRLEKNQQIIVGYKDQKVSKWFSFWDHQQTIPEGIITYFFVLDGTSKSVHVLTVSTVTTNRQFNQLYNQLVEQDFMPDEAPVITHGFDWKGVAISYFDGYKEKDMDALSDARMALSLNFKELLQEGEGPREKVCQIAGYEYRLAYTADNKLTLSMNKIAQEV